MVYHRILNIALCHPVGPCLSKYKNSQLLTSTSHSAPLPTPLPPTTSLLCVRWFCSTGSFVLYYIYLVIIFFFFCGTHWMGRVLTTGLLGKSPSLTSLSMILSSWIHVAANGIIWYGWVVFHRICVHLYPAICRWSLGWFPCLGYCEQCCCEHGGVCTLKDSWIWVNSQEWRCWSSYFVLLQRGARPPRPAAALGSGPAAGSVAGTVWVLPGPRQSRFCGKAREASLVSSGTSPCWVPVTGICPSWCVGGAGGEAQCRSKWSLLFQVAEPLSHPALRGPLGKLLIHQGWLLLPLSGTTDRKSSILVLGTRIWGAFEHWVAWFWSVSDNTALWKDNKSELYCLLSSPRVSYKTGKFSDLYEKKDDFGVTPCGHNVI